MGHASFVEMKPDRAGNTACNARFPSLLAVGAIHHYLIKQGVRSNVSLVVECGDARSTHHFATLLGYGANAINPYMVYDILRHSLKKGRVESTSANTELDAYFEKVKNYQKAIGKGLLKIFAKMGISTLESYQGWIVMCVGCDIGRSASSTTMSAPCPISTASGVSRLQSV